MTIQNNPSITPTQPLLKNYYKYVVAGDLILKQDYKSIMQLPRFEKIVLNTTSKSYVHDRKNIIAPLVALQFISGQKAIPTYARKSIATYKIRQDQILGCKVDLRRDSMYTFFHKLVTTILPRLGEWRPLASFRKIAAENKQTAGWGIGNLMIFPELQNHFEIFENIRGLQFSIVITTWKKHDAGLLTTAFQLPCN